jgi:hypothetical protein
MPSTRVYSRSFAGGEISKEMFGRIDDAKFQSGAATLRNFIATPTGAAENRAGFAYVKATKNNGKARLIPFHLLAQSDDGDRARRQVRALSHAGRDSRI